SRRPRVQPRQPPGHGDELRAREHDSPADELEVGDRLQAAPRSGSRSPRAVDREGREAAGLQGDRVARSRHLEDDSVVSREPRGPGDTDEMNVLVTGASGFIGRNVLLRAPRGWNITALYHSTGLEAFVREQGLTNVRPVRCDLTSQAAVAGFARDHSLFDACLYLAANGDPAKSAARPAWDLTLNTLGLVTLLEHVRVGHFVYVSSGAVYDGLNGAVSPATPVAPLLPYAISKLASEHYLRAFAGRTKTVGSCVNVRFFGAYGPYEPDRKITTKWIRAVMNGQREFTLRGNGQNLIDFIYIDDAVDG